MTDFAPDLEARFLRYVQIDTQSDESSSSVPSTARQLDLLDLLRRELEELGAADVRLTDNGFVIATIPATAGRSDIPRVAFLAHVDTAPAFNGTGVKPIVHRAYDGAPIALPDDPAQVLSPEVNPYLGRKIGDDIVTASGTTLLGADDKAGVAIVMALAEHLLAHPEIPPTPMARVARRPVLLGQRAKARPSRLQNDEHASLGKEGLPFEYLTSTLEA